MDEAGLFVSILLQELDFVGMRARNVPPDVPRLRDETLSFVEKLYWLANREQGDESEDLQFVGEYYRLGFLLLARKQIALRGTPPYLRRLHINIGNGCESVYILALTERQDVLFSELLTAVEHDPAISIQHQYRIVNRLSGEQQRLALLRRTDFNEPARPFGEIMRESGIEVGARVSACVTAVGLDRAMVSIDGVPATVHSLDLDWGFRGSPSFFIKPGDEFDVEVIRVDTDSKQVQVGKKQLTSNPWENLQRPLSDRDRVKIQVGNIHADRVVVYLPDVEVWGLVEKADWFLPDEDATGFVWESLLHTEAEAEVIAVDPGRDYVRLSRRATGPLDWDDVRRRLKPGTEVTGRVLTVDDHGITLMLERGVVGWMDRNDLLAGGHEFRNWRTNIVPGQGIEVVVRRFQQGRRRFSVEFARHRRSASIYGSKLPDGR